jgi:hypothetical protein
VQCKGRYLDQKLGLDRIYPIEALGSTWSQAAGRITTFLTMCSHEAFNTLWDPVYFKDGLKIARRLAAKFEEIG